MLLDELKRRRVPRVAAAYLVIAWATIQVADTIAPRLGMPGAIVTGLIVIAAVGFPVAIILAWFFNLGVGGVRTFRAAGVAVLLLFVAIGAYARSGGRLLLGAPLNAVAVLPFNNLSGDPKQEPFADGISEEIMNALAQVSELKVAARTSSFAFKNTKIDVRAIASSLGVKAVLEGSVRRSGDEIRITAQLTDGHNGYSLWSQKYERNAGDVFAVQDEIARSIVDALRLRLTRGQEPDIKRGGTTNLTAHDLYLVGLHHFSRRRADDFRLAIDVFNQAIAADSSYALAYAGLALVYAAAPFYMDIPLQESAKRGRAAAGRALAIDSTIAEAYAALGDIRFHADYDFRGAEQLLRRAIRLKPSYMQAYDWLAEPLQAMGRMQEAADALKKAIELDPLALRPNASYGLVLLAAGHFDASAAQLKLAQRIDTTFLPVQIGLVVAQAAGGHDSDAAATLRRMAAGSSKDAPPLKVLAAALSSTASRQEAVAAVDALAAADPRYARGLAVAFYLRFGDREKALARLEQMYDRHDVALPFLLHDATLAALRDEARFRALAAKLGA